VLPDRSFDGVVTRVVHEADIQRNTLQVKVAIKDPSPELKPEMLARVRFSPAARGPGGGETAGGETGSQRVFAPESLLRREGQSDRASVWVVDKGRSVAARRAVTLAGGRFEDWVAVASGLNPGDVLIAGDTSSLSEGERVTITGEDDTASAGKGVGHGAH
jgi:multidrug efflux pump subunit AcrA (membrane-fusion protein)